MIAPLIAPLRGKLIVSAQAYPGEPMRDPRTMTQVAQSAVIGGAAAIRAQGLDDCRAIKEVVDLPLIGLWKDGKEGVFITPTLEHALAVADTGAEIVALDATSRPRPDGRSLEQTIKEFKEQRPNTLIMADCSTVEEGIAAARFGADIVGTTLSGYTEYTEKTAGPDLAMIRGLSQLDVPLIAEGRIHTLEHAQQAIAAGAFAVVVGTAITHPATITSWFAQAVAEAN